MSPVSSGAIVVEMERAVAVVRSLQIADGGTAAALRLETRELDPTNEAELRWLAARLDPLSRHLLNYSRSNGPQHSNRMIGVYVGCTLAGVLAFYESKRLDQINVALAVDTPWRRRGLGWALLVAAMRRAAGANQSYLRLIFSRHNWAMRELVRKADARLDLLMDEICADIEIAGTVEQAVCRK